MRKIIAALALGLMMMGAGTSAHAVGVGVKVGSLGFGAELGYAFSDHFVGRIGLNKYKFGADQTIDNIDYTADLDMSSTALLVDWSPFSNGSLHLTAGYVISDNKLSAKAATDNYTIGNTDYNNVSVKTTVELGSGPYFGIGWGNVPAPGIGLTFELGIVKMGTPSAKVSASGSVSNQDLRIEEDNIQSDLDKYDVYPVVSAGISIGF